MEPYFIAPPQHPKKSVEPTREAISRVMGLGFAAQRKVDGHRAQIHIKADGEVVAFTRQGLRHSKKIPVDLSLFRPTKGWTVIDAEWQKAENKIYVFDLLVQESKYLAAETYEDRHRLLLQHFVALAPGISILPLIRDVDRALQILADKDRYTEGLVLRHIQAKGFPDSAIIRCRKYGVFFDPSQLGGSN